MNRRQKIIVSVTGIFLVLLILVGLTYAYFLTHINGNENKTSIGVTTANLELTYGDGNGVLLPYGVIVPNNEENIKFYKSDVSGNPITTEAPVESKTFTVTNNGNDTVEGYGVILENLIVTYARDVKENGIITIPAETVTTLNSPSDFKINITCTSNVSGNTCSGFEGSLADASNILLTNDIAVREEHTYTLTMKYIDTGENQSRDMNKTISAKINIMDTKDTVDLLGNVTNATEGSFVETETTTTVEQTSNDKNVSPSYLDETNTSELKNIDNATETKRSYVDKDGKYSILGLKPGTYKIKYYNSSNSSTSEVKTINIVKGEEASISGDTITITDSSRSFDMAIDAKTLVGTLGTEVTESTSGDNPFNKGTLAYTIVNNALNPKDAESTKYSPIPETTPGYASGENERILSIADDDYTTTTGIPSYYFRGDVKDNYVEFNNMCWRIVRIEGDGSVKIILAKENLCSTITDADTESAFIGTGDYGYNDDKLGDYENTNNRTTSMKYKLNEWFTGYLEDGNTLRFSENIKDKLKTHSVCLGNITTKYDYSRKELTEEESKLEEMYFYDNYFKLKYSEEPTLKCEDNYQKTSLAKVFPLTVDEVIFAGGIYNNSVNPYYLKYNANNFWWTISLTGYIAGYWGVGIHLFENGNLETYADYADVYNTLNIRPSVILKNTLVSVNTGVGNPGTIGNPYVIK